MKDDLIQRYKQKAEECRRLAEDAIADIDRRLMLALAKDFDHKAELEESKQRSP